MHKSGARVTQQHLFLPRSFVLRSFTLWRTVATTTPCWMWPMTAILRCRRRSRAPMGSRGEEEEEETEAGRTAIAGRWLDSPSGRGGGLEKLSVLRGKLSNFTLQAWSLSSFLSFIRCLSIKQRLRRKKRSRTHISDGPRGERDRLWRKGVTDRQMMKWREKKKKKKKKKWQ